MPFLRQILSDRAVTEVILLRAARASAPFDYENLDATVHESRDALSALAMITILKQRQRPKNGYPREPKNQIALIYCKRSDKDDVPMLERLLHHVKTAHPEIGIWCIPQNDLVIELNTGSPREAPQKKAEIENQTFSDDPPAIQTSSYGTLRFRGSFVQPQDAQETPIDESEPERQAFDSTDSTRSDEIEDPDSTDGRTDPTVSPEELEMLFRDSDEDQKDGRTDSETSEDPEP